LIAACKGGRSVRVKAYRQGFATPRVSAVLRRFARGVEVCMIALSRVYDRLRDNIRNQQEISR